jgi:hypothetical protein
MSQQESHYFVIGRLLVRERVNQLDQLRQMRIEKPILSLVHGLCLTRQEQFIDLMLTHRRG